MSSSHSDPQLIARLAAEWRERVQRGERPQLEEYTSKYPEQADEIRDLFSAVVMLEGLKDGPVDVTGPFQSGPVNSAEDDGRRLERIGDFRILREVGRGGMGIVYEAVQESLGRRVALKVLPSHPALLSGLDPQQQKRFQREAKAAARLHHTNIVPVYGVGEADGMHYYVMQFIQGQGLDRVLETLKQLGTPQARGGGEEGRRGGGKENASPFASAPASASSSPPLGSAVQVAHALRTGSFHMSFLAQDESASSPPTDPIGVPPASHNPQSNSSHSAIRNSQSVNRQYWNSIARIGIQVAEALDHAASLGVVHRDIKPSNLLLDMQGTVWVTDFGLAKVNVDADNLTHTGEIVGTLRYIPPERFQGHSDVRGDIYSLGLTLYELLTLRPAFDEENRFKLIEQIMHDDPPSPCKVNPHIPRDLETIVLKAIARDSEQRYQTAAAMARDLERFVEDRPISARRVSAGERFWRWCRRNPAVACLTAGVALLLLVLAVASTAAAVHFSNMADNEKHLRAEAEAAQRREAELHHQAERARESAEKNQQEAERQRGRAEANFNKARAAVDDYLTKVSESQLLTVPGLQPLRSSLLTSALSFYQDFLEKRGDDPELRKALAEASLRVAEIHRELGDPARNEATRTALSLYRQLHRENPTDRDIQRGLAKCWFFSTGYTQAAELWKQLLDADPSNTEYKNQLAETLNSLAIQHRNAKQNADALKVQQQVLPLRMDLVRLHPENAEFQSDLGGTLNNIAVFLEGENRLEDSLAMYRRAAHHQELAFSKEPETIQYGRYLAIINNNIAGKARKLGRADDALQAYQRAAEVRKQLANANPAIASLQKDAVEAYRRLASYQQELGRKEEAAASLRRARDVIERLPQHTSTDLYNLAKVYAAASATLARGDEETPPSAEDLAESRRLAGQALAALQKAVDAGYTDINQLRGEKDFEALRSRVEFKQMVARIVAAKQASDVAKTSAQTQASQAAQRELVMRGNQAASHFSLGLAQLDMDQPGAAAQSLAASLEMRQSLVKDEPDNADHPIDVALTHIALGQVDWKEGRLPRAEEKWREGLEQLEALARTRPQRVEPRLLQARLALGHLYADTCLWEKAAVHFSRAVELTPRDTMDYLRAAACLVTAGDVAGYRKLCEAMVEQFGEDPNGYHLEHMLKATLFSPHGAGVDDLPLARFDPHLQKASRSSVLFAWGSFARALAAYRAGRFAEAILFIERYEGAGEALRYAKLRALMLPVLAMAQHRLQQPEQASRTLAEADRLMDDNLPAALEKKPAWFNSEFDWAIADALRREAHQLIEGDAPPVRAEFRLVRGRAYAGLGEKEKAEAEFDAAAKVPPEDPRTWFARGRVFAELGETDRANADLARGRELLEKDPPDGPRAARLWRELALALQRTEQPGEAANAYERAIGLQTELVLQAPHQTRDRPFLDSLYQELLTLFQDRGETARIAETFEKRVGIREQLAVHPLLELKGHTHNNVRGVAVLPDGRRVLSAGDDYSVRLWDLHAGKEVRLYPHDNMVGEIALLPDGLRFLSATRDMKVRLWDVETGEEIRRFEGHLAGVWALAVSPDGRRFASGGYDNVIRVWDVETGKELRRLEGHTKVITALAYSPDGRSLLSSGNDDMLYLWDAESGAKRGEVSTRSKMVYSLTFSEDGKVVWAGLADSILVWNLQPDNQGALLTGFGCGAVRLVSRVANEPRLLLIGGSSALVLWDLKDRRAIIRAGGPGSRMDLARLGAHRLVSSDNDGMVRLWSLPLLAGSEKAAVILAKELTGAGVGQDAEAQNHANKLVVQASRWPPLLQELLKRLPDDPRVQVAEAIHHAERGDLDSSAVRLATIAASDPHAIGLGLQTTWWVVGPYPAVLETPYPPEPNADPFSPVASASPAGKPNMLRWRYAYTHADGLVPLSQIFSTDRMCVYAVAYFYSPVERELAMLTGDDDAMWVWVNGELVHKSGGDAGGPKPDEDSFLVTLKPGWNKVLVKGYNSEQGFGFYLRLSDKSPDLARAYQTTMRWKEAARKWTDVLAAEPNNANAWRERGLAHQSLTDWQKAIEDYNRAIELDPTPAYMFVRRAHCYRQLKQHEQALADYDLGIQRAPDNAGWIATRASLHMDMRQWEKALADFTRAIELRPDVGWWFSHRARCYANLQRFDEADADHRRSLELADEQSRLPFVLRRGHTHAMQGRWKEAADDLQTALEGGTVQNNHWELGNYVVAARIAGQGAAFEKARALLLKQFGETTDPVAASNALRAYLVDPADRKDTSRLEKLAALPLQWGGVKALAAYRAGKYQEALELLKKSTIGLSEHPFLRALIHHQLGEKDAARQWLEKGNREVERAREANPGAAVPYANWQDWARLLLWQREAQEVIGEGPE